MVWNVSNHTGVIWDGIKELDPPPQSGSVKPHTISPSVGVWVPPAIHVEELKGAQGMIRHRMAASGQRG